MNNHDAGETLEERHVTYTLELDGCFYVVENVPARVDVATGEEFFAPETVERLHAVIRGRPQPKRWLQTPVYEFAGG